MGEFSANFTKPTNEVPEDVWDFIHKFLLDRHDQTLDLRVPHLKNAFIDTYSIVIAVYAVLVIFGMGSNLAVVAYIICTKLYKDETFAFLLNNCCCDLIKCVVDIPVTLFVLMVHNWVLGELLCPVLPMIQVSFF